MKMGYKLYSKISKMQTFRFRIRFSPKWGFHEVKLFRIHVERTGDLVVN